jgi:tetratricopeptide (TPR) repeat protein
MDATASYLMAQLRQDPLDPGTLESLRKHCESARDPDTWAEALEHHARAANAADADPIELGRLHYELGNLYRDQLGRNDRAITHYRAAIDFDAAQRAAIGAARAIFTEAGKWDQVAKLLALEAESLPEGAKRVALMREQASLLKERLADPQLATDVLREAVGFAPEDLASQHELATLLLDQADLAGDARKALPLRSEAADILHQMAQRVSDDYALAYLEAALDAIPDHEPALRLLQTVAPRMGRADAVPARWVASIQHAPDGPLSRELRLKLAVAYRTAGQLEDARLCLKPLVERGDAEALARWEELSSPVPEAPASEEAGQPLTGDAQATEPGSAPPEPTATSEALTSTLSELTADEPITDHSTPLADLAALVAKDAQDAAADLTMIDPPLPSAAADAPAAPASHIDEADDDDVSDDLDDDLEDEADDEHEAVTAPGVAPANDAEPVTASGVAGDEPLDLNSGAYEIDSHDPQAAPAAAAGARAGAGGAEWEALLAADSTGRGSSEAVTEPPLAQDPGVAEMAEEATHPRAELRAARESADRVSFSRRSARSPGERSRPPPANPDVSDEPEDELTALRRDLKKRLRFRDRRGAADLAMRMLALGAIEPDAITALEDHYRMTRDFRRMRDLAMRIAREAQVPPETRIARLREAAMLSESKLGDVEGTALAWREVLLFVPTDEEANTKLRRLLTRLSRWDELCHLLEQRALAESDPHERASRYRELALLQRDRRKSLDDAIDALEKARELDPGQISDATLLCELYEAAGRPAEAAEIYLWRVERSDEPVERIPLLVKLSDLYEHELGNLPAAYATAESLLQIAPRHVASLDRMLRIDERLGRWDNLIHVLEAKLAITEAPQRAKLHAQIGDVALNRLEDPQRASDAFARALEVAPDDRALISHASAAFEQAGRRDELTESIASAAQHARDATKRFDLFAMVAERREADGEISAAIAAREAQLAVRRDVGVLGALVELLRRTDRANDLVRRLDEFARAESPERARELRLERAAVLAEQLSNLEAAKGELTRVLEELAPDDTQVLEMLLDLCRRTDDVARRTEVQERLVALTPALDAKIELVTDLVETYEKLSDTEGAIRVLRAWIGFDPGNPQPHLHIAPFLEKTGQRTELLATYDSLATLAMAEDEAGEYLLRAARVAIDLEDHDGAWNRLVPRVVDAGDEGAEDLLKELAARAGRPAALAELYVGLAQRDEGQRRWLDAAHTYENMVGSPDKALEAVLRAFAKDLDNIELLAEADRLAEVASAWPRLEKVYDALVRRAETPAARSAILMRHAQLLAERAHDARAALTRASLAFQIDPVHDAAYEEATRLAQSLGEHEQLLGLYERRSSALLPVDTRLSALLEACRTAHGPADDAPRAASYLARAVGLTEGEAELLDKVEARVRELEADNPPPHGRGLVHALSEVYRREADEGGLDAPRAAVLFTRAAKILDSLDDLEASYEALARASEKQPHDEGLLDDLLELAERAGQRRALAAHLTRAAERAIDSTTASAALWRLGALYEGPLASADAAAETYAHLVKLNPQDLLVCAHLRKALEAAGRHQELLLAIERELSLSHEDSARLELLKEMAAIWEHQIGNRFEALDAWRKVLARAPEDGEALTAVSRLTARPSLDLSFLDADLVVLPEDLRPSLPPEPTPPPSEDAAAGEQALAQQNDAAPEPQFFGEATETARAEPVEGGSDAVLAEASEHDASGAEEALAEAAFVDAPQAATDAAAGGDDAQPSPEPEDSGAWEAAAAAAGSAEATPAADEASWSSADLGQDAAQAADEPSLGAGGSDSVDVTLTGDEAPAQRTPVSALEQAALAAALAVPWEEGEGGDAQPDVPAGDEAEQDSHAEKALAAAQPSEHDAQVGEHDVQVELAHVSARFDDAATSDDGEQPQASADSDTTQEIETIEEHAPAPPEVPLDLDGLSSLVDRPVKGSDRPRRKRVPPPPPGRQSGAPGAPDGPDEPTGGPSKPIPSLRKRKRD